VSLLIVFGYLIVISYATYILRYYVSTYFHVAQKLNPQKWGLSVRQCDNT